MNDYDEIALKIFMLQKIWNDQRNHNLFAEYDENRVIPMTPRRNDLVVKKNYNLSLDPIYVRLCFDRRARYLH